jgi:hypothetical protein
VLVGVGMISVVLSKYGYHKVLYGSEVRRNEKVYRKKVNCGGFEEKAAG